MINAAGWFHCGAQRSPQMHARLRSNGVFVKSPGGTVPSHSKFYMQWGDSGEGPLCIASTLDWCLYTSANLSKVAWGLGEGGAKPQNYEAGVLLRGPVHCTTFEEKLRGTRLGGASSSQRYSNSVTLPYPRELVQYEEDDVPTDAGLLDALRQGARSGAGSGAGSGAH